MFLAGLYTLAYTPGSAGAGSFNFIPFRILSDTFSAVRAGNLGAFTISFLGNIVMFMPLGVLPALLWERPSWKRAALIGLCASFLIEFGQLFLNRSTDIDDLILNILGALAGYWIYVLVLRLAPGFILRCRIYKLEDHE